MTLLFQYTFKKFFLVSFILTVLIIFTLWLAQSLRFMDLIVNNRVSIGAYFSLVVYLLPDLFVIISPIAFAIASLFCFHRLMISHELAAFRSLGISNLRLSFPVLTLASGLFLFLGFLNMIVVPASFQKFREQQHLMRSSLSSALLREGSFNTAKGFTLYIREHNDEDELNGIFIFQPAKNNLPSYTTLAETGRVYKSGERILILLKKGQRQEYNPTTHTSSYFSFDEFVYDLTEDFSNPQTRPEKAYEKSLKQLLNPDANILDDMKRRFKAEAHQRILLPFLCLLDALLIAGILLSGELGRRYNRKKIVCAAGSVLFIHLIMMGLIQTSIRIEASLYIAYSLMLIGIVGSFWYLSRDFWSCYGKKLSLQKQWER